METTTKRNIYAFGLGTVGRDMVYTMVSMYLIFYLTDILGTPSAILWWINGIIMLSRIFDALNDPVMGVIVDNTKTKYGKFKPWISFGALASGMITVLLFTDFGLTGTAFVVVFGLLYLLWGMAFTTNDISYWSMLPALSMDQKEREKIGSFAKICANIGLFTVVAGLVPLTTALGNRLGSMTRGYTVFTMALVAIMWVGQAITVFGVKEKRDAFKQETPTTLKGMLRAIVDNDQLLFTAISMSLFMIGYVTTTSFGLYFFKYAYGDEGMYSIFAVILGVSQIGALAVFPLFSKAFSRKSLYSAATALVVLGYLIFFFSPMNMLFIGTAGILMFLGQAFIQILMLMFLADTVEYGQWKLGKRNESVTFSLQPFINKMGGAIASGIVGATVIVSGINDALTPADVTAQGLWLMKSAMLILPLVFIVAGYLIYRYKYRIDPAMYRQMLEDLQQRGDLRLG
ncbi:MAG: glycoside-pentoside-hexuronide (GPH):cation symporter [Bacillota bacterium]|jgi:melibiose permease/lactose/raffinose/galactose permease|nr:glycoside-pentoside-hexuronide (GPH):cation symporter [Bacillota bacterium]HHT90936.1 sugar transporter [Bacillota bacterium]